MATFPSLTYIVNTDQVKIVAILNKADLPDPGPLVLGPDCIELTPNPSIDSETAIAVSVEGVISIVTDEASALVKRTRQWAAIRVERNVRLAASDFTQLPDIQVKMTDAEKLAWVTYRQALRDFPTGDTNPNAPVWPIAPGAIGVVV